MRAGELPLELIRMKAKGCEVELSENEPGFTLPSNIGEIGDDITELELRDCSLHGAFVVRVLNQTYTKTHEFARRRHPGVHRQPDQPADSRPLLQYVGGCVLC